MFAAELLKLRRNYAVMAFAAVPSIGVVVLAYCFVQLRHASTPQPAPTPPAVSPTSRT
jgi:hypothetical protein